MRFSRSLKKAMDTQNRSGYPASSERGYTLVEIGVVLMIVGLFIASGLQVLKLYKMQKSFDETDFSLAELMIGLGDYLEANGHYPCVAPLDAPRGGAGYGLETDCDDTSVAVGTCANGICVEENMIDTDGNAIPDTTVRVRRGAVPFRVLNMPEDVAYDGFGSRIEYVVTERLASPTLLADFNPQHGAISVVGSDGQPVIPGMTHFLLISRGANRAGAWSRDGVQVSPCPATGFERENCNTDTTSPENQAIYRSAAHSFGEAEFFDDIITYRAAATRPLWKATDLSKTHITDLVSAAGGLGAGNEPDSSGYIPKMRAFPAGFDGDAAVKAEGNFIIGNRICDENGLNCFRPEIIGGTGMSCPNPGEFMIGIANAQPICVSAFANACPAGQFMNGISPEGRPLCAPPPSSCAATSVTICGSSQALAAAFQGTTQVLTGGDTYSATYRCNSSGSWVLDSSSGECVCPACTPSTWTNTGGCGSYMIGNVFTERERRCFPNTTNGTCEQVVTLSTTDTCECNCADGGVDGNGHLCRISGTGMSNRSKSCPAGFNVGNIRRQCPRICSSSGSGTWYPACRDWESSRAGYSCEALGCTPWDDSECACGPRSPQTQTRTCVDIYGPGYVGTSEVKQKQWNCPGGPSAPGSWDADWTVTQADDCSCGSHYQTTTIYCDSPAATAYGFGPGYTHTLIHLDRTATCHDMDPPWSMVSHSCQALVCKWKDAGAGSALSGSAVGQPLGDNCPCGSSNDRCYADNNPGYRNYYDCRCEPVN